MKNTNLFYALLIAMLFPFTNTIAVETVKDSKNPIIINKEDKPTIVGVAASNNDFSTLVDAVKAADLVETLNAKGPFTVFAPTNSAFAKLPNGTIETLLKPENKKMLTNILTYHVIAGKFNAADVVNAIKANNGAFQIETVQGEKLTASIQGEYVMLTDAKGNASKIIITDVKASNGVIHAIDTVIMPK